MILIEISDNPNCDATERVFHDVEPLRPASQVRLTRPGDSNGLAGERHGGPDRWFEVTGWTIEGNPCPARLHKVDDSGDGVAYLLSGGNAGLRLRPAGDPASWRSDAPQQWGEPFLIIGDRADIR